MRFPTTCANVIAVSGTTQESISEYVNTFTRTGLIYQLSLFGITISEHNTLLTKSLLRHILIDVILDFVRIQKERNGHTNG